MNTVKNDDLLSISTKTQKISLLKLRFIKKQSQNSRNQLVKITIHQELDTEFNNSVRNDLNS